MSLYVIDKNRLLEQNLKKLKKIIKEAEANGDKQTQLRALALINDIIKILQKDEHPESGNNESVIKIEVNDATKIKAEIDKLK